MSKVVRGIRKVFKKVGRAVKKIAPIILAAAAIYFTAGAALGVTGMAGGWAGAAGSISSSLGATGTLGSVVTGAITQAGYGAAIGGVMSKAGGGSFTKGAQQGAAVGAVTGGITGGLAGPVKPTTVPDTTGMNAADEAAAMGGNFSHDTGISGVSTATPPSGGGLMRTPTGAPTPPPAPQAGWLERNQALAGNVISGLGQGLMARGQADSDIAAIREKHKLTSQNYNGTDPGVGFRDMAPGTAGQNPSQRFDPASYGAFDFQYNPATGRIERVARQS